MTGKFRILLIGLIALGTVSACDSVAYYAQAVSGQAALLWRRQPIDQLLADPALAPELRHKLLLIQQATDYADRQLGLPAAGSYDSYVELQRRHLVWNVFAAPAFSVQPMSWCFPIAGCVDYRGYFSEAAAWRFAEDLQSQGFDVYVGGVDAYSTLGWFNDPVPSTVIRRPDHQLAGLIFHELAHQRIYVPDDTSFNESFASFVSLEGLRRWLAQQDQPELYLQSLADLQQQQRFIDFVLGYRERFAALYARDLGADAMREQKDHLQAQMRAAWQIPGEAAGDRYEGWFQGPLNNAQLATVGSYYTWVPAFAALFREAGEDFDVFYQAVADLASLSPDVRRRQLLALMPAD
ncbi:MAG: aminopeptidase [Gammaproteobacteria bacterium]|nr:aminopeptidase [Gammaproteobacteria bacterium]|tara:strand:- start:3021 stop:4073 length:1053 start_codon:yes stop_codon:yes gene_type:complete